MTELERWTDLIRFLLCEHEQRCFLLLFVEDRLRSLQTSGGIPSDIHTVLFKMIAYGRCLNSGRVWPPCLV